MPKNWRYLEILIGVLQCIAGIFMLLYMVSVMFEHISYFEDFGEDYRPIVYNAFLKEIILISFILLPQLIGGILLIAHKKLGWTLTLISCLSYIVLLFIIGQDPYISVAALWVINGIGLVLSLIIIALLSKPFLSEYQPSIANWLIIPAISNLTFALLFVW